jgi:uncharacterized protein YndB with AHSA1/START domain
MTSTAGGQTMSEKNREHNAGGHGAGRELVITRLLDAPRALVFRAWTEPRHLAQWWSPRGFTNPVCELDLRPGGRIRIDMRAPDGVVYEMGGAFEEIVEPERLVFTSTAGRDADGRPMLENRNTVTLEDAAGKTKVTVHILVLRAAPEMAGALAGMEQGWTETVEKLAAHVAIMSRTQITVEPGKQEITVSRIFDAPADLVFRAWTDPVMIPRWWGPRYLTTTVDKLEARSGGSWRFVQRAPDGGEHAFHGVYHEVTAPRTIIGTFEYEGMPGHVALETETFEDLGGKTRVVGTSVFPTLEDRDGMVQSGMESGVIDSTERMAEVLAELQRESTHD